MRLVLSCFCILLEQYRFLGLESLRGATVDRLEVISSRLFFRTALGLTEPVLGSFWFVLGSFRVDGHRDSFKDSEILGDFVTLYC